MKIEDLKLKQLLRFIGKDPVGVFMVSHIWKVTDIDGDRVCLTDMKGIFIKTHSVQLLREFEPFIPGDDEPVIEWKTEYLGVVK